MKTAAELCECLPSCAGRRGVVEGSEMQLGDLEDFLRAAFDIVNVPIEWLEAP